MEPQVEPSSLAQLALYFLRLGTTGFGGPIALAEYAGLKAALDSQTENAR